MMYSCITKSKKSQPGGSTHEVRVIMKTVGESQEANKYSSTTYSWFQVKGTVSSVTSTLYTSNLLSIFSTATCNTNNDETLIESPLFREEIDLDNAAWKYAFRVNISTKSV